MASLTITRTKEQYTTIMSRRDIIKDDAIAAIAAHGEDVRTQLDAIGGLDHHTRATRAASFAIMSPQADFSDNVRAVPTLLDLLRNRATPQRIVDALASVGYKMCYVSKAQQYSDSRSIILDAAPSDINYVNVQTYQGFGQKTASMFCALYDQWQPVCTLDTWMLNGFLGTAATGHKKNKCTYTASGPAYDDIAAMAVEIAAELNVSPFLMQWSLWTYYRGTATDNHLPIFGI